MIVLIMSESKSRKKEIMKMKGFIRMEGSVEVRSSFLCRRAFSFIISNLNLAS